MSVFEDGRTVLTLDARGTNFVFSAIKSGKRITEEIRKDSNAHDLGLCLNVLKFGFNEVISAIDEAPKAISFAFPGPADYPNGIIGDLPNLPAFRGGIPLKAILEKQFNMPVFINNDGDLFAYGEALGGILTQINQKLKRVGSSRRYRNIAGLTLGTGFGGGIVRNEELFAGDNSIAGEVWLLSNRVNSDVNSEELVSTRFLQKTYAKEVRIDYPNELMPKDIHEIAIADQPGDKHAALVSFDIMGKALGDAVGNLVTLLDGVVVIGGGITAAKNLYMPSVMEVLRGGYQIENNQLPRLIQKVFNLDDKDDETEFYASSNLIELKVPGTEKTVAYDPVPKVAIATSRMGASNAIALGAYAFALKKLEQISSKNN